MQTLVDFSGMDRLMGLLEALSEVPGNQNYKDALFDYAYGDAEEDFNKQAAALGATGTIKHMFEWGTLGINRGRSSVRPGPLTERARLWKPVLSGGGFNRELGFVFKPSIGTVPKPTKSRTGMSVESIGRLGEHFFTDKARIMESGAQVTIMPKQAKALLIPLQKGNRSWATPAEQERGFAFRPGPIETTPGATSRGQFTAFFTTYWNTRGRTRMENTIGESIDSDFQIEANMPAGGRVKNVRSYKPSQERKKQKRKITASVESRAKGRRNARQ